METPRFDAPIAELSALPERSAGVHFPALDGYRALAALMVVTTHVSFATGLVLSAPFGPLYSRLDSGVTIFFVLSGFLLFRPWSLAAMTGGLGPRLAAYGLRRGARVLPAYWLVVIFTLLVLPEIRPVPVAAWWKNLALLHIYFGEKLPDGLTQMWSLATEVAFYLALPLIAWVAGRRHRGDPDASARWQLRVLAGLALTAVAWNLIRTVGPLEHALQAGYWLPGHLDWFAAGMAMAVISARISLPNAGRGWNTCIRLASDTSTCVIAAIAIFAIGYTPIGGAYAFEQAPALGPFLKHSLYGMFALLLLAPGILNPTAHGRWHRAFGSPIARFLGLISYGIFLWNQVLLSLIIPAIGIRPFSGNFVLVWFLTVVATVLVATASFYLLERPLQRWSHRRTSPSGFPQPDQPPTPLPPLPSRQTHPPEPH